MFKWFKKEQSAEPEKVVAKIVVPCVCETNSSEHCDLILKLRERQKIEKELLEEIKKLDRDNFGLIFNLMGLLKSFESNGLIMNDYYNKFSCLDSERAKYIVVKTIDKYSYEDIFRLAEELKTYKNKYNILVEKRKNLSEIQKQIKDIKNKLGIE